MSKEEQRARDAKAIAQKLWDRSLQMPEVVQIIEAVVGNEEIQRKEIYELAFSQGVISVLIAIDQGNIVRLKEPAQAGPN